MMVSQNGEWLNAILNISVPIVHVKAERLDFRTRVSTDCTGLMYLDVQSPVEPPTRLQGASHD
jgi:hypothetical protein